MKRLITKKNAFTLVELLIVIALIAILAVAVLATINPIEQANKAKDSTVQNDAAEVMNSYERYYANAQSYPWMRYGATKPSVDDAILLRSDTLGFGICDIGSTDAEPETQSSACDPASGTPGELITADELKPSFVGKDEFRTVGTNDENGLWLYKTEGSGGGLYVCYVPKAKSNRNSATNQLYCLDDGIISGTVSRTPAGTGACTAPSTTATDWSEADSKVAGGADAEGAIFKCVP